MDTESESKEYSVSIRTNDIHEAIATAGSALYSLVEEALQMHEAHEAEECEFESSPGTCSASSAGTPTS